MPRVGITREQKFKNYFHYLYSAGLARLEAEGKKTYHLDVAKYLGLDTRTWLRVRRDPFHHLTPKQMCMLVELFGWTEANLKKLYNAKQNDKEVA